MYQELLDDDARRFLKVHRHATTNKFKYHAKWLKGLSRGKVRLD